MTQHIDTSKCINIKNNFSTEIDIDEIQEKILKIKKEFCEKQVERDDLASMLLLALFSKTHLFLIGPPGVSKTGGLNIFATCLQDNDLFEVCIKDDTKYEELFGDSNPDHHIDMEERLKHSIVKSKIAIIDEIWKGNSKVSNSLLSIASHNRTAFIIGLGKIETDLSSIFAASNELAQDSSLAALSDRFTIKMQVQRIQNDENWKKFITKTYDTVPVIQTKVTLKEINSVHYNAVYNTSITDTILEFFLNLKKNALSIGLSPSDRRFDDAQIILRTSAFLNKRTEVNLSDFFLLEHILWNELNEIEIVKTFLKNSIFGNPDAVIAAFNDIENNIEVCDSAKDGNVAAFLDFRVDIGKDEVYNQNMQNLQEIYEMYNTVLKKVILLHDHYEYCIEVENMIKNNIFVKDIEQNNFSDTQIEGLNNQAEYLADQIKKLEQWHEQYGAKVNYNEQRTRLYNI